MSEPTTIWNKNFICVLLANLMLCTAHATVNPLVATYTKYLNTSAQLTGLLAGMFYGVSLLLKPFAGPVMTKHDKRKLLIMTFVLGAIANIGYAIFHTVPAFTAFRVLSGIQYGFVGALVMALCANYLPKDKMTYGIGIFGIGGSIGFAIGPWLGETMLKYGTNLRGESLGFTFMFLLGALLFILGMIPSIMIDSDRKTQKTPASSAVWYKNIVSVHALLPAAMLFFGWLTYSIIHTYAFEFGKQYGIPGISTFFLVLALSLAVSRPLIGYLNDRIGIHRTMFPALAICAAASLVLGGSRSLSMLLAGAVIMAIGFGASIPALQAMGLSSEPMPKRGVASNTIFIGTDLGLFLGPYIGGLIYAQTADYSIMFKISAAPVVLAMICFAAGLPAYSRRKKELETLERS